MLQTARQISKFSFLVSILFLGVGCASLDSPTNPTSSKQIVAVSKLFPYSYESVWRAAQLSVKYPIAVNSIDTGVLETDWIKAVDGFENPAASKDMKSFGFKYKIILNISKGKNESRPIVRASVTKKIELQRDFFSETEAFNSDGLEEKAILYRIERELVIEDAIKKAAAATSH